MRTWARDVGRQLPALLHREAQFLLDPIPNLYFTRDPFAAIGNGASLHRMFSETRARETLFGDFILRHHPDFAGRVPLYYSRQAPFSLEGGDILNLSARVLAVGASERTMPEAIEDLALQIFADPNAAIETILVLDIPGVRAYMHLDTVFTQVDWDTFVIHPGILPAMSAVTLERGGKNGLRIREQTQPLDRVLARLLELPAAGKAALLRRPGRHRRPAGAVERRGQYPLPVPRGGGHLRPQPGHQPDAGGQRHPGPVHPQQRAFPGPGRPPLHEYAASPRGANVV